MASTRARLVQIGVWAGVGALVLAAGVWLRSEPAREVREAASETASSPAPVSRAEAQRGEPEPVEVTPYPAPNGLSIDTHGTLALAADSLSGGPVPLSLRFPDPTHADELRVTVLSTDGRGMLDLTATIEPEDRRSARVEIDPSWLRPGRYIVQLHTTEQTIFQLRRYVLEIR